MKFLHKTLKDSQARGVQSTDKILKIDSSNHFKFFPNLLDFFTEKSNRALFKHKYIFIEDRRQNFGLQRTGQGNEF